MLCFLQLKRKKKILKTEYKWKQMNLVSYQVVSVVTQYEEFCRVTFKHRILTIYPYQDILLGRKKGRKNFNCI